MNACMYVYMYTYMHTSIHTLTKFHTYDTHPNIHTCMHAYIHTCMHTYVCGYVYIKYIIYIYVNAKSRNKPLNKHNKQGARPPGAVRRCPARSSKSDASKGPRQRATRPSPTAACTRPAWRKQPKDDAHIRHIHVYVYIYIYICVYLYTYMNIYTYIHTYAYVNTHSDTHNDNHQICRMVSRVMEEKVKYP